MLKPVVTDFTLKSRISVPVRPSLGIFCPRSWGWDLNPGLERVIQILQLFHVVSVPFPTKPLQPPSPGCCFLVSIRICFRVSLSAEFCLCLRWTMVGWWSVFSFQLPLLNPPKWLCYFMASRKGLNITVYPTEEYCLYVKWARMAKNLVLQISLCCHITAVLCKRSCILCMLR